jgi:ribosome recycling factor
MAAARSRRDVALIETIGASQATRPGGIMVEDIIKDLKESYEATVRDLVRDLGKLRTGRANINMLDGVRIEYYGQQSSLNQVAALKVADARLITVQPWERTMINVIEKAINSSDLGFNCSNDGVLIRVPVPALTGERRQDLTRLARKIGEEHKIALRNLRRDSNEMLKDLEKEKEISEDDLHRALARVDQSTTDASKRIDELVASKEADILEV